jgi:hypothetical protein
MELGVRVLEEIIHDAIRLRIRPMVDEVRNRNARRELGEPAVMVAVPVRDDQVIDPGDTSIPRRRENPRRVTHGTGASVSGIDEQ